MRLDVKAMKKLVVSLLLVFSDALLWGQGQSSPVQPATKAVSAQAFEHLSVDTPKTTVLGNAFVAPKGWSIRVKGPATILEAPEGDSWVALVDVQAKGPGKRWLRLGRLTSRTRSGPSKSATISPTEMAGADVAFTNT